MNADLFYRPIEQIRPREIERLKLEHSVSDDSGERPVMVSVVVPTFNKGNKKYNRAVMNVISTCGSLIDGGVIDEVVIAEGSRTEEGEVDMEFIEFLLSLAIKYSRTFEKEVEFVRSLPEGKMRALQGRYDFSFRIQSQIDPELHKIYMNYGILDKEGIEYLKSGKGANMWFSVPVTYGDVICFVDSDILSFQKHYVKSLCYPILKGWRSGAGLKEDQSSVVFTKARYIRLHEREDSDRYKMGGRLSRLFGVPIFQVLSEHGVFEGLDEISYPFSGECAITRKTLNRLQFSNGYDVETSVLCQLWKDVGMDKVEECNYGFFRHLPGSESHVDDLLEEISMALFYWIRRYDLMDKIDDLDSLLEKYDDAAMEAIKIYQQVAEQVPSRIKYDEQHMREDMARVERYKPIIRKGYERAKTQEPKLLEPWKDIKEDVNSRKGQSYDTLKSSLQNRVNKFTSNMLLSYIRIYVDRSENIISKFVD